jgi:endonuclease YncB( thermonuclease family)
MHTNKMHEQMKKILLPLVVWCWCTLLAGAQLSGRVVAVADGDTFTLLTSENKQVKIRLHGIDCPEKKQPHYHNAKSFTAALVMAGPVRVQVKNKDRYGRTIGIVLLHNQANLNELLLQYGWAWHFAKYDSSARWAALQQKAKQQGLGLWANPQAIAPWDWRAKKKR